MASDSIQSILSRSPIWRYRDLMEAGIHHRQLDRAVEAGLLVRPVLRASMGFVPNLYISPELEGDPDRDDVVATFVSGGVIALRTAAVRQQMTTGMPRSIDVWVDHKVSRIVPHVNVNIHRTRNPDMLHVGVEMRDVEFGLQVRITGPARTVVDLFHAGRTDADDYRMALEALSTFLSNGGEPGEVIGMAKTLNLDHGERISLAVHAAYDAMSAGGMSP